MASIPVLYSTDFSPPCRAVLMLSKAIGLTLNVKEISIIDGQHRKTEYKKINPQHTLPTLDDDGFILWDSHAINIYLINKYAKDVSLYPEDIKLRAVINQRLHFNDGVIFSVLRRFVKSLILRECDTIPEYLKAEMIEAYGFLEAFLEGNKWACGNFLTVADIQLVSTITSVDIVVPLTNKFPNIKRWLSDCAKASWYEANLKGLDDIKNLFSQLIKL